MATRHTLLLLIKQNVNRQRQTMSNEAISPAPILNPSYEPIYNECFGKLCFIVPKSVFNLKT